MSAQVFVGKKILVGLTYLNANGDVREQLQLHGFISSIGDQTVAFENADGSGLFSIPFDGQLDPADPEAVYTLRSTGESVTGVDFVARFTIHPPTSS